METKVTKAVCILNNPVLGIEGLIKMEQIGGTTYLHVKLSGLKPGRHGFHIHEWGDLTNHCMTAGGHYNPFNKEHGGLLGDERHVGDLGNLEADDYGNVDVKICNYSIKLRGIYSVIGRSFVVHEDEDDLGLGKYADSKTTGHAGARLVCGIIGLADKFK